MYCGRIISPRPWIIHRLYEPNDDCTNVFYDLPARSTEYRYLFADCIISFTSRTIGMHEVSKVCERNFKIYVVQDK